VRRVVWRNHVLTRVCRFIQRVLPFQLCKYALFFSLCVCVQEAVVSARFSTLSPGSRVGGMFYKPVEQFILPKVTRSVIIHTGIHVSVSVQYKIIIIHNCVSCLIYIYIIYIHQNNSLYPWTGCILHGDYINKSVSDTFMSIIVQGFCDLIVFSDQSESSISEWPVSAASDS